MDVTPAARPASSRPLRRRIMLALGVVSLLPLLVMGVGAWVVFGRLLEQRAFELQRQIVASRARSIEAHLAAQQAVLRVLAETHTRDQLADRATLRTAFAALARASDGGFVDLGVIAEDGDHLAYVGPYDLSDRNYSDAPWFGEVMARGTYISDVFLGFRQVPHMIVAIRVDGDAGPWILRATLSSERLDALVATDTPGSTGSAFLVNREGLYQTSPPAGEVLDEADLPELGDHPGVRDLVLEVGGEERLVVTTWIASHRWLLVVQRSAAEVRAPVARAVAAGALVAGGTFVLVLAAIGISTRMLCRLIDRANREREEMTRAFMRSAKLASVGRAGHRPRPRDQQPARDHLRGADQHRRPRLRDPSCRDAVRGELLESAVRIRRQVERCGAITRKMLQFGRTARARRYPPSSARAR